MEFIKKNIKAIGYIGCCLMIIGNFLPFVEAKASLLGVSSSESMTLFSEDVMALGITAVVLEVIIALLIKGGKKKLCLIPVIIVLAFLIICKSSYSEYSFGIGTFKYGSGFYSILIGCILCGCYAFIKGEDTVKVTGNGNGKFCAHCGAQINNNSKFCKNCGKKCDN